MFNECVNTSQSFYLAYRITLYHKKHIEKEMFQRYITQHKYLRGIGLRAYYVRLKRKQKEADNRGKTEILKSLISYFRAFDHAKRGLKVHNVDLTET